MRPSFMRRDYSACQSVEEKCAAPSPVPKGEGPGAPSAEFDIVIETGATCQRITALLHRAGEEFNLVYPALLSSWTGIAPPLSADGIPKLAQEMEMVAIWINRRQYNEADLLK